MLFPRYLWVQDEARYGEVVREMLNNGNYLVPTLDGRPYSDKPPFYFWILAIQASITGVNTFSFRIVTFLSMLAFGACFFIFSRRLIGTNRAMWAEFILLTSMLYLVAGNIVRMDLLMALFVLLSLHYFMSAVDEGSAKKGLWGHGLAFLALMVKGPLGVAFPLLGAMAYAFVQDRWKGIRRLKLLYGLIFDFVVVCTWIGYLYICGHKVYLEDIVIRQIWSRSVKSWSHPEPFYFYALVMFPLLMPWLPFVWQGFRQAPKRVIRVILCWFLPGFVLISAISGKLFIYLGPILPAIALLIAAGLPAPWEDRDWNFSPWQGLISGIFFILFGLGIFYVIFNLLPEELGHLAIIALIPLLLGIGTVVFALQKKEKVCYGCFCSGVVWCPGLAWDGERLNSTIICQPEALVLQCQGQERPDTLRLQWTLLEERSVSMLG